MGLPFSTILVGGIGSIRGPGPSVCVGMKRLSQFWGDADTQLFISCQCDGRARGNRTAIVMVQYSPPAPAKFPPWEGEAPAEPKSTVTLHWSLLANNRSPGIPARPPFTDKNPVAPARQASR